MIYDKIKKKSNNNKTWQVTKINENDSNDIYYVNNNGGVVRENE